MKYYLGTSGFSYDSWIGEFYPENLERRKWLNFYSKYFNTTEINMTFYRFPFPNLLKGWYRKTPKDFKFTLKANRQITHIKKLKNISSILKRFYSIADELKEKLGCILFQVPPFLKKDKHFRLVKKFLQLLNSKYSSYKNVLEFRHKSWYCDEVLNMLKDYNTIFCVVSAPRLPDICIKTSKIAYVRFHGVTSWYDYDYSKNELKFWATKIKKLKAKEIYVYFNNDYNAYAVKNCKYIKKLLR